MGQFLPEDTSSCFL